MIIAATLYAVAILVLLIYGGNLFWLSYQYARRENPGAAQPFATHRESAAVEQTESWIAARARWPIVTVQLPVYNEANVVERLIDACAQLDYPSDRLEIQVLDDSTDETSDLAAGRVDYWRGRGCDIMHIRRNTREGFKAGALANGFHLARGDYIAIFDADFLPKPDILKQLLLSFDAPEVGAVQARWGHLNAGHSTLTRLQAFGLDMHFALEQYVRPRAGYFFSFNGTAGIWRSDCIADAGGWQSDTLTEDMDLSYRAQLAGWRLRYRPDQEAPAELPISLDALRAQQSRWAKGAAETSKKLLGRLWKSTADPSAKIQGTLHITGHFVFFFLAIAAALHAPLVILEAFGNGPGTGYFLWMTLGLIGFTGYASAHVIAQRALYPDWIARLRHLPAFMAGSIGLSLDASRALMQGLVGRVTPFLRTPKLNLVSTPAEDYPSNGAPRAVSDSSREMDSHEIANSNRRYLSDARTLDPIAWWEAGMAGYCVCGFVVLLAAGQWTALPFQAVFAAGFGLTAGTSLSDYFSG